MHVIVPEHDERKLPRSINRYPSGHWQVNPPRVLIHVALVGQ